MTNPCGRSFLSYRRSQHAAAKLLIEAQHEYGVPTWLDVRDLENAPLEPELQGQLLDAGTANAVWFLTPDVADSPIIRNVEFPLAIERQRRGDDFFVKPIAAGGLDYATAASLVPDSTLEDLTAWNVTRLQGELDPAAAAAIAESVLDHRLRRVHRWLDPHAPLRVSVFTRAAPDVDHERALTMDWTHRFAGRVADADGWNSCGQAAIRATSAVRRLAPGRRIHIGGLASLPASVLLGSTLLQPIGVDAHWLQRTGGAVAEWSLSTPVDRTGIEVSIRPGSAAAKDLALLGSVNRSVEATIARSRLGARFRAFVEVQANGGSAQALTPGQGTAIARELIDAARRARDMHGIAGDVHLFLAVPAAVAFMVGQLLNTFGRVHTYEHIPETDSYQPAIVLQPSA